MTASETDLCRRLEDYRRNPLGVIAMNSSAPTIRAQELEIQRLKAEVSELSKALNAVRDENWFNLPITTQIEIDAVIAKHGGI